MVQLTPRSFVKNFGRESPEEVLAGEFLLCQGIRFAFDVKHPFRALRGAVMDLRRIGDIEVRPPPLLTPSLPPLTPLPNRTPESTQPSAAPARSSASAPSSPTPTSTTPPAKSC